MEQQGMSFPDAVQYLADRAGMTVPHEKGAWNAPEIRAERKKKQQTLEETLQACADFYRHQLQINPPARQYLDGRGLNAEIIGHYGLGYAPDGWQPLAQVFQPYPNNALTECGQVIHNEEQNRYYDRFRHRIMFPSATSKGVSSVSAAAFWTTASPNTSIRPTPRCSTKAATSTASTKPATPCAMQDGYSS